MNTMRLTWNTEAGKLTSRWMEREERPEYSVILIETGATGEHPMDKQADQFLVATSTSFLH